MGWRNGRTRPKSLTLSWMQGVDPTVRDNQGQRARDLAEGREELKGTGAYRRLMSQ